MIDNVENDLVQGDREAQGLDPDCPACGSDNVMRVALPDGEFVCVPCGKAFNSVVTLGDLREEAGKIWDQKHAGGADLDPFHIDDPELTAEQRAIRVAERSGMHVWGSWPSNPHHGCVAYQVAAERPRDDYVLYWRNPALEEPMCNDNDPQASMHHVLKQLSGVTAELALEKSTCRVLQKRARELTKQLAERTESLEQLMQATEVVRRQLAACRAEYESLLEEAAAIEADRDRLREACRTTRVALSQYDLCSKSHDQRIPATELQEVVMANLEAALETKTQPTGDERDGK